MCVHAKTLTVKASCIHTLETEMTTDICWNNEASGASAQEYSAAVLSMQKQYDWEHRPIINGGKSGPFVHPIWERKDLSS